LLEELQHRSVGGQLLQRGGVRARLAKRPGDCEGLAGGPGLDNKFKPRLTAANQFEINGSEHDMTRRARRFARQLQARFRLPVDLADERLSSVTAEAQLRETGRGGREHKNAAHELAATIILQSYLDEPPRR